MTAAQIVWPVGHVVGTFCVLPPVPLTGSMQVKWAGPPHWYGPLFFESPAIILSPCGKDLMSPGRTPL